MNKKILGAAVTVVFCVCLIATSSIQESAVSKQSVRGMNLQGTDAAAKNDTVAAGASLVLSEYSFTTESDEKASIEKNETAIVASKEEPEETKAAEDIEVVEETEVTATEVVETEVTETQEVIETEIYENRWGITLTEEEKDLLARIVWLESNAEPELGQQAVVEVVFNRMTSDKFPNTLYDVLSQRNPVQFCSWKSRERAKPTEKEYQSIEEVLKGNTNILRNDTVYFSRKPLTSKLDIRISEHSFCY